MEKFYKALIEVDGRLESVIAGLRMFKEYKQLTYREGEITYAPEGSLGLFVYNDIERAKKLLKSNSAYTDRGRRVIHEMTPLGSPKINTGAAFAYEIRYPAILLGKEVWTGKPEEPTRLERLKEAKELFGGEIKRGVMCFSLCFCAEGRSYHLYAAEGSWILYDGNAHRLGRKNTLQEVAAFIEQDNPQPEPKFKVGDRVLGTGGIFKDNTYIVEAVRWNDVTKECKLKVVASVGGYYLEISHDSGWIASLGIKGDPYLRGRAGYRVREERSIGSPKDFTYFVVEKKVVK